MKTVINLVLAACAVVLVYICYGSIMGPINFDKEKKVREDAIIARLIDIQITGEDGGIIERDRCLA